MQAQGRRTVAAGSEWLLFRLAGRGYATPRQRIDEVVDVGAGQPPVPGLPSSSLAALKGDERPVALVSLRAVLGLPERGPTGRLLVVSARRGRIGFLVDEVVQVLPFDPKRHVLRSGRMASSYVSGRLDALGESWQVIDWDAIRLPPGVAR